MNDSSHGESDGHDDGGTASGLGDGRHGDALFVGAAAIGETAARLSGADGAAVAVVTSAAGVRELVYATDALAQQIDELQFVVGEGPCLEAHRYGRVELCPELSDPQYAGRWPAFVADVTALGAAALFAFPIPGRSHARGVLELYRRSPGALTIEQRQSAQICAAALQAALETNWRAQLDESGSAAAAAEESAVRASRSGHPITQYTRSQVYVAAGMVAVQLKMATTDAVTRLRAYAYAHQRSVLAVAADVIDRRLSFADLDDDPQVPR